MNNTGLAQQDLKHNWAWCN